MFPAKATVYFKLSLGSGLFSCSHVGLSQSIVRLDKIRLQFDGLLVFSDRVGILQLIGVQDSKLEMRVRKPRVKCCRTFQQGFDLAQVRFAISGGVLKSLERPSCCKPRL